MSNPAARKDDAPMTLESLEPIRQSIRHVAIQDQYMWDQSWKSVLSDINQTRRGLLLPDVFQQTLALNEIALTRSAFASLVAQFQLPNGLVQAHKFLQWIDLTTPRDHVDPELVFARLPQPYRRVLKVLESDILDAAWEMIKRTSARYKAETSAGMSVRSARSSVLLLSSPTEDGGDTGNDDYATAKKRCCKTSRSVVVDEGEREIEWLRLASDDLDKVSGGATVSSYAVAALARARLVLVDLVSQSSIGTINVTPSSMGKDDTSFAVTLLRASRLRRRRDASAFVLAVLAQATPQPTQDTTGDGVATSTASCTLVYEFTPQSASNATRLVATIPTVDAQDTITCVELSELSSLVAVASLKGETSVYSIDYTQSPGDAAIPSLLTTITTATPATSLFFLNAPLTDLATLPSRAQALTRLHPYALALVAGNTLVKSTLPRPDTTATLPAVTWQHLSPITSASIDSTTQYVTLGLADGLVVVWDVLEEQVHAMLPPRSAAARRPVDCVVQCADHFVVSLSLAAQQLQFFNLSDRAKPSLVRCVTPPPASQSSESMAPATRFLSLSPSLVDLPVVMVEYSNGYAMLYDVRNGEAMGSVRMAKPAVTLQPFTAMNSTAVVAIPPSPSSLAVYSWDDLLTTSFPTLPRAVEERRLARTTENLKRVFIASVELHPLTLTLAPRLTLHSLLLASAGHSHQHTTSSSLSESKSSSSSATSSSSSHTDSRSSLASTAATDASPPPPLPGLVDLSPSPYKPTVAALFERACGEELPGTDSKVHRRRNELLKILTAAW